MPWAEKTPNGRYAARYRLPSGKQRSAGTFESEREAQDAAAVAEHAASSIGWRDPSAARRTWGEWRSTWEASRTVDESTKKRDESRMRTHLSPRWQDVRLMDISRLEVKTWAAELLKSGLAPATVTRCTSLLSASLAAAVDADVLAANPASRLRLPTPDNAKERYLTRVEAKNLMKQFPKGGIDRALVATLLGTGMRWGEAVALHAENVDLQRNVVRVRHAWDVSNAVLKQYTKGKKRRTVPLPDWVRKEIKPFVKGKTGYVFASAAGTPIGYRNWQARRWTGALDRANISNLTIHDLRHTFASWLIQAGVPLEEVGRLLGHVSPITTRRYAHLAETPTELVLSAISDPSDALTKKQLKRKKRAENGQNGQTAPNNIIEFRSRDVRTSTAN